MLKQQTFDYSNNIAWLTLLQKNILLNQHMLVESKNILLQKQLFLGDIASTNHFAK